MLERLDSITEFAELGTSSIRLSQPIRRECAHDLAAVATHIDLPGNPTSRRSLLGR